MGAWVPDSWILWMSRCAHLRLSRRYFDIPRVLFALFYFDPLRAPCGRFEGFGKVLSFMDDPAILKLHNADRLESRGLILDDVLGDPQIVHAHDAADQEAAWFFRMVATQSLQVV